MHAQIIGQRTNNLGFLSRLFPDMFQCINHSALAQHEGNAYFAISSTIHKIKMVRLSILRNQRKFISRKT